MSRCLLAHCATLLEVSMVVFGCWALVGCGSDAQDSSSGRDFRAFDDAVSSFLEANDLEGASVVVVSREEGVVHVKALGSFEEDRVSLIASSSKVMSAGVLMHLADQGLLDVDAPVSTYLGDWGEYKTDISVAQMLSNSAGMVGLIDDPLYGPYLCQYLGNGTLSDCAKKIYTADDTEDRIPPDTEFRYGGGQWQLAGGVAEVVSGKRWGDLIDEIYVQPCGLESTGYNNHYSQGFASGGVDGALTYPDFFQADPSNLEETQNPSIEGGAYTTARDYGKILWMHLSGGRCGDTRVLSEASVARMQEDRIGEIYGGSSLDPSLPGYGFGWWVSREEPVVADPGAYGATPWLDNDRGYAAMIILEAKAELGVNLRIETKPILDELFPLPQD
ncbi:MAG: beta-lactamase family protein [Myxococcales bacterium]|nr:beta-lactamase family protein [Myxococcales bacterium]